MAGMPHLSLIIPAYNEVLSIGGTLDAARTYLDAKSFSYEVIVCADGTDGTREHVRDWAGDDRRFTILGGPERRGKGHAIRLGVHQARGQFIGFMDADHKTPVDELDNVLPWLERGYDMVIGSRALGGSRIERRQPLHRRLGSKGFGVFMRLLLGLRGIPDTQCGFKFFRGEVAKDLFAKQRIDGYMFDVEVLHLAGRSGYRIQQVGVRWRDDGDTRLRLFSGNLRNLLDLLRIRFGRVAVPTEDARGIESVSSDPPANLQRAA
jgi:dolichyl-phosphate beta-glucosyltransferase